MSYKERKEIEWREVRPGVFKGAVYRYRFRIYTTNHGAGLQLDTGFGQGIGNFRDVDAAKAIAQRTADLWNDADIRP